MNKIISRTKDWLFLIAYVTLIYATLPFMPGMVSFFSSLLGQYFYIIATITVIGIVVAVFTFILINKPVPRNPMFYVASAVIFGLYLFLILFATPIVAEKMHLLEYGLLSYFAFKALKNVRSRNKRYLCVVPVVILVGCCDEIIQRFTPGRYCEIRDMVLNIVSGFLGLFVLMLLEKKWDN